MTNNYSNKRLRDKRTFTSLLGLMSLCLFSMSWAHQQDDEHRHPELVPITSWLLSNQTIDSQPEPPTFSPGAFIENDGLIVVEMESLDLPSGWTLKNDDPQALGSYIEWTDRNSLQNPGRGTISVKVVVNQPGTYQFIWRNSIRDGNSNTDANDSFLKILSDNFSGFRARDNSTVCPRDQETSNRCDGRDPVGSSRDGWFKIYRSGGPTRAWLWSSFTSDSDAHTIFAEFDNAGEYEIQISGRSEFHAIDRFVLFRSRNSSDNIAQSFAIDSARPESGRVP